MSKAVLAAPSCRMQGSLSAGYASSEYMAYEHGISRPHYGKYETGANIQLNTLMKILKAMNVTLEEFFKGFD